MATPTKKVKVDSAASVATKKPCPYGASCYRKNPVHFAEFSHPGGVASTSTDAGSSTVTDGRAVSTVTCSDSTAALPACKYGAKCYRKNLLHFAEFSHPTVGPVSTPAQRSDGSDSGDTDVYDSDADAKTKARDKGDDVLKRGMSLVKSFSQMTEQERKELIHKAFEAKLQLQKELQATREQVLAKDRELHRMQEEVNKGILLVEGEEEALKGSRTVYFPLMAERDFREGSADQIHFRLAESQFYRLISGETSARYRVTKVLYVVTPHIVNNFKEAREHLRKERGEDKSYPVLAFHGTNEDNITPICENGFKVPGEKGFHHKTDTGWYGAGVYFSEYPSYSIAYISGSNKLLLCQVLPGKVFECTTLIHGAKLQAGFDSHMSPCKKELIIFNSHHILPCYVVHYTSASTEFKYQKVPKKVVAASNLSKTSAAELEKKKQKAKKAPKSSVFQDLVVKYYGPDEAEIYKLVAKHKGSKGTYKKFNLLAADKDKDLSGSVVISSCLLSGDIVVTTEFLYQSILQKTLVDKDAYYHKCMFSGVQKMSDG